MKPTALEEQKIFEKFKDAVKDLEQDDYILLRFFRARNHDLVKAEDMLRKSIKWRRTNDIDNALNWSLNEKMVEEFPYELPGVDYKNRVAVYLPVGSFNLGSVLDEGLKEEILRHLYICFETIMSKIKKSDNQFFIIVDLEEMTYRKCAHYGAVQLTLQVFRFIEANYPECMGEVCVINAPFVLNSVWPLIKPLLTGSTLSKVSFLGSDETKYIPYILERMPASSLPTKLNQMKTAKNLDVQSTPQNVSTPVEKQNAGKLRS